MILSQITPLFITKDEMANLPRSFPPLYWAKEIVVIDSFSTDGTVEFLKKDSRVHLLQRPFDTFAQQCSFGLEHVTTPWILSLDADYCLTKEWIREVESLEPGSRTAFETKFSFSMQGHLLRSSLYPPRYIVFKKGHAHYEDDGHGHHIVPEGETGTLNSPVIHDDRKPFSRWWQSQKKYASLEAEKLFNSKWKELPPQDNLRKLIFPAPFAMATYTLLGHRLLLDGPPGWFYCLQRTLAEALLSAALLRLHLFPKS